MLLQINQHIKYRVQVNTKIREDISRHVELQYKNYILYTCVY
jgi:hypothetical protein